MKDIITSLSVGEVEHELREGQGCASTHTFIILYVVNNSLVQRETNERLQGR